MMTHPLHVAGNLPIKTLVARQLPTNVGVHTECANSIKIQALALSLSLSLRTRRYVLVFLWCILINFFQDPRDHPCNAIIPHSGYTLKIKRYICM